MKMAQDHLSDDALRQRGGLRDCAGSFWGEGTDLSHVGFKLLQQRCQLDCVLGHT